MLLLVTFPLLPQEQAGNTFLNADEILSLVGMKLSELIENYGTPKMVFTARGNEQWQDDVVFQYDRGDFYIYKDRVWQVKLPFARGISIGDPKAVALLVMGESAEDNGDHLLLPLSGRGWPLMFRVNFNNTGYVSGIYVYRPDY